MDSLGATLAAKKSRLLVRDYERMTLCGKALGDNGEYITLGGPTAKNSRGLQRDCHTYE